MCLQDDRGKTLSVAWQDQDIGNRIVRGRVLHWPCKNHVRMRLQTSPNMDRKGVFVLEASHQKKPEIWELITEPQESFHQLGNAFVTGQTPNKYHDRRIRRDS